MYEFGHFIHDCWLGETEGKFTFPGNKKLGIEISFTPGSPLFFRSL